MLEHPSLVLILKLTYFRSVAFTMALYLDWCSICFGYCLSMARETGIQSQVESYQGLKKWYLMPTCLTLSIITFGSRVNRAIQGKEEHPNLHFSVVAMEKGAYGSPSTTILQLIYIYIYVCVCVCVCVCVFIYISMYIYTVVGQNNGNTWKFQTNLF